ncbi:FHA domain-containing protein [Pseudanabaena sp. FACHB-1998]|uniref:FHA domain-containing protein n=1 Tax=Pseudanabaena sp. FACHB-1998 TaxID=2692858 RepID=UPI0016807F61|nr:FHA domain-containing protein [Pseudanabaena sp. FACHB-1998]MBD2179021.1 FHA domain-containing protein [Pseudanabaena sp. FACHB-1998]
MMQSLVQLSWLEINTNQPQSLQLSLPIAIGKDQNSLPTSLDSNQVSPLVLSDRSVSRYHALLMYHQGKVVVIDQNSTNGVLVNGSLVERSAELHKVLGSGDRLTFGRYEVTISFDLPSTSQTIITGSQNNPNNQSNTFIPPASTPTILFSSETGLPQTNTNPPPSQSVNAGNVSQNVIAFPPEFFQLPTLEVQSLHNTGLPVYETTYGAIGGGLGSYIWADYLRIFGVAAEQIVALGLEPQPYARYKRLCLNSQIPLHERLRSNSDSCPDNIWGFPSYAWREAWHDFTRGKLDAALKYIWQVFAEPDLAETYTPRSGNVFDSIDREASRIGWDKIYRYGRVRSIRKTNDGRYAIAYSLGQGNHAFLIAQYLHLAMGYAAIQFLPDLQAYRSQTEDFQSVVNGYEEHEHIYEHLEKYGGTVLIRGRGIVASRIVQRIYEVRQRSPQQKISLLHLMRSPKSQGNIHGRAHRTVENHYEFQPFNWPKACWGGDLREVLEEADPETRQALLKDWGGTTTADRHDWKRIVQTGLNEGWYQITFGDVEKVDQLSDQRTATYIRPRQMEGLLQLTADFIIDATGLDAKVHTNPLFADLLDCYNIPVNGLGRLNVSNDFEITELRNGAGRVYASGAATLGNSYAAVDSFLGLQFAALRSVDSLVAAHAPQLHYLNGWSSLEQWFKWLTNQAPN